MEGVGAPFFGFAFDGVVDEAGELGPGGEGLPEVAVDGDGDGEAEEETEEAGWDYVLEGVEGDAALDEEVEGVADEEEGEFGAEDDARGCEDCDGAAVEVDAV